MPARMAGAVVFTPAAASMAAVFTRAHFTADLADFTAADGMVASRASTMVSATATTATGTMGWRGGSYGWWWGDGLGGTYYPYGPDYDPDYGYYGSGQPSYGSGQPSYGSSQPSAAQNWYYCSDPAGYYPYVAQCNTGWQTVPAS